MKNLMIFFLFCSLIFLSLNIHAQHTEIDSLQNLLKIAKHDTSITNILNALGRQCMDEGKYNEGLQFAQQAEVKAEKSGYQKGVASAFNNKGLMYYYQRNYEKALVYHLKAMKIRELINDKKGIANSFNNIGLLYYDQGDYERALNNHFKSLKIREEMGDKYSIAMSYNNIGIIYEKLGNYEKSIDNHLKSLIIKEEINDKKGIAFSYNNIGNIYLAQNNFDKALSCYQKYLKIGEEIDDKFIISMSYNNIGSVFENQGNHILALDYQLKSLKIKIEVGDKQGIAYSFTNIGGIYENQENYVKALEYQLKSLKISKEIGDTELIAVAGIHVGNIYVKQGKFKEALHYNNQSLILSQNIGFKVGIKDAYSSLSNLFDIMGDYKQAFNYHKLYFDIKDTLLNEQSGKQIAEMNTKYDTEKKDKEIIKKDVEIIKHQAETERQTLQRNAFIIGFALVIVLAFFIFKGYRQKQNANKLLEEKNVLIEKQKQLVEEKNGKITDSINYAKRIQQAILPSEELIKSALPESFVFFKPKDIVSGDFYWLHTINNNEVLFAVADCTGHGVPGALMSMMGFNLLEQVVKEHHVYEPALILNELSKLMIESLRQTDELGSKKNGLDIALCKINYQNLELEYAGAYNSLYLIRNGILNETKADRRSVGISSPKATPFSNHKIKLEKDDCLYIFSDGYADQKGGIENKKFFYQPFKDLLIGSHQLNMNEQEAKFGKVISEWQGVNEQIDDMLLIGVRI